MTDLANQIERLSAAATPMDGYLIRKGAYWYRPNAEGYTTNPAEAGRYSLVEADLYTHPNGKNGQRVGLSFVHEADVPGAVPRAADEAEALRARVAELSASVSEMIAAMHRYEMDVDADQPEHHRAMMSRARKALKAKP